MKIFQIYLTMEHFLSCNILLSSRNLWEKIIPSITIWSHSCFFFISVFIILSLSTWKTMRKYHRLDVLHTTETYLSQFWRLKVRNQGNKNSLMRALFHICDYIQRSTIASQISHLQLSNLCNGNRQAFSQDIFCNLFSISHLPSSSYCYLCVFLLMAINFQRMYITHKKTKPVFISQIELYLIVLKSLQEKW